VFHFAPHNLAFHIAPFSLHELQLCKIPRIPDVFFKLKSGSQNGQFLAKIMASL
jgi:hypothetical protein